MPLVKWSPLKELEDMRRDMDRLFDDFFAGRRPRWSRQEGGVITPVIELFDRRDALVLRAELPGGSKEEIDLTITKETITIKGELKRDEEVKSEDYFIAERLYGSFSRTVQLPFEIDEDKADALFKNGILEVVLPKKEDAKPKETRIEVK
ncbi:MAG TPA: Hsp20/alpha crystallin family protein [Dissulfurispiraceae bacterium]|nr:Hsp20/alpha crystallin family protein [Dissulfurispiraceae bacterium]